MMKLELAKTLHGSDGLMRLEVDQSVNRGDFIVIMGESGVGKSTLLRIIAGLEEAEGMIQMENESWMDHSGFLPAQKRNVGFVFQDFALFDNMTVKENLLFFKQDPALAEELLEMTEIKGLAERNVQMLSGGQKQRVALARAFMGRPRLLLMDEPLGSLDPRMRHKLTEKIKALHLRFGMTTLMISHDLKEAKALANRVWFIEQGKVNEYDLGYLRELY